MESIEVVVGYHEPKLNNRPIGAMGIGDALLGLLVVNGLKKQYPDKQVTYVVFPWQAPWVMLFEKCYDRLAGVPTPGGGAIYLNRSGVSGKEDWAHMNKTEPVLPAKKTLSENAKKWAEPYKGCVVLSPWALQGNRTWLTSHWMALEKFLMDRGYRCVIVDGRIGDGQPRNRTAVFQSPALIDETPENIAALMECSLCVVANDSAMAHVAGALQAPCIALVAQLGTSIMKNWPTVKTILGPLSCSGCNFAGDQIREHCNHICASLQAITPQRVLEEIELIRSAQGMVEQPIIVPDPVNNRVLTDFLSRLNIQTNFLDKKLVSVDRGVSFTKFFQILARRHAPLFVVETGCQRQPNDIGAGMSTSIIGAFLSMLGGYSNFISVDTSPENVMFARNLPIPQGVNRKVVCAAGAQWLRRNYYQLDAVYLDSKDTYENGYAECCLEEATAAYRFVKPGGVILIDDTVEMEKDKWEGKGQLAVPYLLSHGFELVHSGYQQLLVKGQ